MYHAKHRPRQKMLLDTQVMKFRNGDSGATSWVHVDVREFTNYKADDFYIKEKNLLAPKILIQIAKELKLIDMCNCLK